MYPMDSLVCSIFIPSLEWMNCIPFPVHSSSSGIIPWALNARAEDVAHSNNLNQSVLHTVEVLYIT